MTHSEIEAQDVLDRYLMRRLPEEVAEEFEAHYLACWQCLEKLEAGRDGIAAIREASTGELRVRRGKKSREWRFVPAPAWGLAALLAVAGVWAVAVWRQAPKPLETPNRARPATVRRGTRSPQSQAGSPGPGGRRSSYRARQGRGRARDA